MTQGIHSKTVQ